MKNFLSLLKNRKIDYVDIKEKNSLILLNNEENYFINVIIGCRGRKEFLPHVVSSFNNAIDFYKNNKICLTIVEHNPYPEHLKFCKKNKINYVWTCGNVEEQYSRSFAYNFGVKYSNDAKYYLLHDLDILVKKNFFLEIEKNLNNFKCLQTYGNRRVLYMSKELTEKVLNNEADYNFFNEKTPGVSLPMFNGAPALGSKGGSILIEKDLFYKVGGFDPEIFWGYAAEDQFFWEKVLQLTEIGYSDNPVVDIFHMWHPPSFTTNPSLIEMENYWLFFKNLPKEEKINVINLKKEMYE